MGEGKDSQTAITRLFKLRFLPKKVKMCSIGGVSAKRSKLPHEHCPESNPFPRVSFRRFVLTAAAGAALCLLALAAPIRAQNWPQASGPNLNWKIEGPEPPLAWSVVGGKNILWRTTLPEGGQSAVTIWGDRAFVTTHRPMNETSDRLEPYIVGYCLEANTGKILVDL